MTTDASDQGHGKPKCGAVKHQGEGTCTRPAGWGTPHPGIGSCKLHGGNTETHLVAAQREQARRDVELFGARVDVAPQEALLELVQWTAGEVAYWRARVSELDEADLTWGITREKEGGDDRGTTREAKPNIAYSMYVDATRRLEAHSAAAIRGGCETAMVRLQEQQGLLLAGVVRRIVERMFQALVDLLGDEHAAALAAVEAAWAGWVADIVPGELRAIEGGQ